MELLSQIPVPKADGNWAAFYAVLALFVTNIGRWITEARKDRKDAEYRLEREKILDKLELHRQHTADRTADSNEEAVQVLGKIESKMQEAHILSRVRHEHVSGTLAEAHIKLGVIDSKISFAHNGIHEPQAPRIKPKAAVSEERPSFP